MDPRNISINNYSYLLPEEKIAKYPLADRDASKLLIYKNEILTDDLYRNIASQLPADALMVFNDTRVIEARLLFQKPTGGLIEIFCLEPADQFKEVTTAMAQQGSVFWKCLIGGASKWKPGTTLQKKIKTEKEEIILNAKIRERLP